MVSELMIEVEDLVVVYPDGTLAVDGISFGVQEGEIFGLLGPNGAGKTTTINILTTLRGATSGRVFVSGYDVRHQHQQVRRLIGCASQQSTVDLDFPVRDDLTRQAQLHHMSSRDARTRAEELIRLFNLAEYAERSSRRLSIGTRRKLDLATALVHRPPLLFLDEPTTGLDPEARQDLWRHLKSLNQDGVTILLTTQYMEEADQLANRLVIMDRGQIAVSGTPDELKESIGSNIITVSLQNGADPNQVRRAVEILAPFAKAGKPTVAGNSISLPTTNAGERLSEIVRSLDRAKIPLRGLERSRPTLDDVFLKHTGRKLQDQSKGGV